jgi:hypothetical protein
VDRNINLEDDDEGLEVDEADVQDALSHTLTDVWSGRHHALSDDDDFEDEEDDEEKDDELEDQEGEDVTGRYKDPYTDWHKDESESSYGLSALDILGEDFERDAVKNCRFTRFDNIELLLMTREFQLES